MLNFSAYRINSWVTRNLNNVIIDIDTYFDPNPKYNMCYCENCLKGRKDKRVYNRGIPPTKYAVPIGWTRFSLRYGKL